MTRYSTEGLYSENATRALNELQRGLPLCAYSNEGSSKPIEMEGISVPNRAYGHPVKSCIAAIVTAFGSVIASSSSCSIDPNVIAVIRRFRDEENVADFFDPVQFPWDEDTELADRAARWLSERTHANY